MSSKRERQAERDGCFPAARCPCLCAGSLPIGQLPIHACEAVCQVSRFCVSRAPSNRATARPCVQRRVRSTLLVAALSSPRRRGKGPAPLREHSLPRARSARLRAWISPRAPAPLPPRRKNDGGSYHVHSRALILHFLAHALPPASRMGRYTRGASRAGGQRARGSSSSRAASASRASTRPSWPRTRTRRSRRRCCGAARASSPAERQRGTDLFSESAKLHTRERTFAPQVFGRGIAARPQEAACSRSLACDVLRQ